MTESEWLAADDPKPMLEHLNLRASPRKLRLFAAACCRRVWHLLEDERCRTSVEAAEAHADGRITAAKLQEVNKESEKAYYAALNRLREQRPSDYAESAAPLAAAARTSAAEAACVCSMAKRQLGVVVEAYRLAAAAVTGVWRNPRDAAEMAVMANRLRDVLGNVFRPASFDATWRAGDVASLAKAAYQHRAMPSGELEAARLSILADALEDGGCTEGEILAHLRSPGGHVRGCWALDLVLGKK